MSAQGNRITRLVRAGLPDAVHERRVLAVRVLDLTQNLVTLAARRDWPRVAHLLVARRALLERLPRELPGGEEGDCVLALRAAMAESDRTLGLLIAGAELGWPGGSGVDPGAAPAPGPGAGRSRSRAPGPGTDP
jgi:hypothetical protein